jgi:hypothetical protein
VSIKFGYMDKTNQAISSEIGFSSNMEGLFTSKKERAIARILTTKLHTKPATDPELEVMLNPITRDLIISMHVEEPYRRVVKKKRSK